jgi:hypothetical protein
MWNETGSVRKDPGGKLNIDDIASTQLYLTMTPELLHEASQRFAQYVFGEVSHG